MTDTSLARIFLGMNAAFSLVTGLVLLSVPDSISHMMFVDPEGWKPTILRASGVGLLVFALGLALLSANPFIRKRDVMMVSLADLGWVLGSALLVLGFGHILKPNGVLTVDIVAAFVALFAIGQVVGTCRIVAPLSRVSMNRKSTLR